MKNRTEKQTSNNFIKTFLLLFLLPACLIGNEPVIEIQRGITTTGSQRIPDGGRWVKTLFKINEVTIGSATAKLTPDGTFKFGGVNVDKNYRNQGIAKKLYRPLFNELASQARSGCTTWIDTNEDVYNAARKNGKSQLEAANATPSAKLWRRNGWVITDVSDDPKGILKVFFQRDNYGIKLSRPDDSGIDLLKVQIAKPRRVSSQALKGAAVTAGAVGIGFGMGYLENALNSYYLGEHDKRQRGESCDGGAAQVGAALLLNQALAEEHRAIVRGENKEVEALPWWQKILMKWGSTRAQEYEAGGYGLPY